MSFTYDFPMAGLTADVVIFRKDMEFNKQFQLTLPKISVLLIQRGEDPYKHEWALPGGFVNVETELVIDAAHRELEEETKIKGRTLEFLGYYDMIKRDPRRRVITFAFISYFYNGEEVKAGDDAIDHKWVDINGSARNILAFDHKKIITDACKKLGLEYSNDF